MERPVVFPEPKMAELGLYPENLIIEAVCKEAPVPADRLNIRWLRERFASPIEWEREYFDEQPLRRSLKRWISAGVLVPLVDRGDNELTLLFTRRAVHLQDHAGQVSFPGGRVDETDITHIQTALREMEEEVGVERERIEVLGTLPEYRTGSGFSMIPVVSVVRSPFDIRVDPDEVDEVFEVPLSFLMTGANHERVSATFPGYGRRFFYAVRYNNHFIWGATAGVLRNFFHFMRA